MTRVSGPGSQPSSQATETAPAEGAQQTGQAQQAQGGGPGAVQAQQAQQPQAPISPQDAAQRRAEHDLGGVARQAQLQGGRGISEQQILQGARNAGLNQNEVTQLQNRLQNLPAQERQAELRFLRSHVLNSPNADRALRTYTELQGLHSTNSNRITSDVVHTLTRSVADRRTNVRAGAEGVMGQAQAIRAANTLINMPQSEYNRVTQLMNNAGQRNGHTVRGADPQAERALILKAVAARSDNLTNPGIGDRLRMGVGLPSRTMADIETYARDIRGTNRRDLINQSTVLDLNWDGRDTAMQQRFTDSCGPTTGQMARAEADPIYARQLHQEAIHGLNANTAIGREQRDVLTNYGGVARTRSPFQAGGVGMPIDQMLNDRISPYTGKQYNNRVDLPNTDAGRQAGINQMAQSLQRGEDVPIRVAWPPPGGGAHFLLATDVRGTPGNRQFLITDPWTGRTMWRSEQALAGGNTSFGETGTGRLANIYL